MCLCMYMPASAHVGKCDLSDSAMAVPAPGGGGLCGVAGSEAFEHARRMQSQRDGTASAPAGLESANAAAAQLALTADEETNEPLSPDRFFIHPESLVREGFESLLMLMTVAGTFVLPLPVRTPTPGHSPARARPVRCCHST